MPVRLANDSAFMADPYPAYSAWRDSAPVHRSATPDGAPVWVVTRYDDVRAALSDSRLSLDKANSAAGYTGFALPPALDANLLNMDPPDHTRLRRLVSRAFTARRVAELSPEISRVTEGLLDAAPASGPLDLIEALAAPLPMIVIGNVLGVREADRESFRTWTDALLAPNPAGPVTPRQAIVGMEALLRHLVARHRRAPDDTLLSAIVAVRDAGDQLSEDELTSLAFLLLWAGYEATVHLIGNGLLALLQHPAQLSLLRDRPELITTAVEEMLRYAAPAPYAIRRFATTDLEIGGVSVAAGETVLLLLAAADRDPARVAEPDAFQVARVDNPHLAFGHGIHYCLGAPLGRLEAQIAIGAVLRRYPRLRLAVPVERLQWRSSFRSRGLRHLPVDG
jgi:cytochrome P450